MAKNLVIVESPAKAKTIGKFLGPDYTVTSSYGHIRDLKKKNFGILTYRNRKSRLHMQPERRCYVCLNLKKDWKQKKMRSLVHLL